MQNLINRKQCKELALRYAMDNRKGWDAKRVSKTFLDDLEAKVRLLITGAVMRHRTVGKTITDLI